MPLDTHKGHNFDESGSRLTEAIAWVSRLESPKAPAVWRFISKPHFFESEK